MKARIFLLTMIALFTAGAVLAGMASASEPVQNSEIVHLANVRDFAPSYSAGGVSYAVDGGLLLAGGGDRWQRLPIPVGVIANAVAVSSRQPQIVYMGAANELALYVSSDAGRTWMKVALTTQSVGAVTAIAVDAGNRLIYVGTDTDGVHRLRDVGTSMIAAGHLLLDEPVEEIVAASNGMALVRTAWHLYRAEEMGMRWVAVENLPSPATALAIAQTTPPTFYVGTASSGVRMSQDGVNWQAANAGLGFTPGSQLFVNALAVDPAQPAVVYAATSLVFGSTNAHISPVGVAMSNDGAAHWSTLSPLNDVAVAMLMPVSGATGSVYSLTARSRTPVAMGRVALQTAEVEAPASTRPAWDVAGLMARLLGALAVLGLIGVVVLEMRQRGWLPDKEELLAAV